MDVLGETISSFKRVRRKSPLQEKVLGLARLYNCVLLREKIV
jgi:hypothetical protein